MKKLILGLVMASLCSLAPYVNAGPLEDVVAAYEKDEFKKAYNILLPLASTYAKPETAKAQYMLGNQYLGGFGVSKSEKTAWIWHRKAVDGLMKAKNYAAIEKMLQPYMNNNIVSGKIEYAKLLIAVGNKEDRTKGRDYIKKMATEANAIAQYEMAKIDYVSGMDKFERIARKIKWYKLSADQGYAPAQIAYGNFLGRGSIAISQKIHAADVIKDMPTADKEKHRAWKRQQKLKWLMKAAAQNDADGQYAVGYFHRSGIGASVRTAHVYFKRASAQGHLQAQYELAYTYAQGYGTAQNKTKAANLYQDVINRMGIIPIESSDPLRRLRGQAKMRLDELTQEKGN